MKTIKFLFDLAHYLSVLQLSILLFSLALPSDASAQKFNFQFLTTADGLAGNNTSTVTQDEQGFLWLINDGKLHRYDGRNFEILPFSGPEPFLGLSFTQDSLLFIWSEHYTFLFNPKSGDWKPQEQIADDFRLWQNLGQRHILLSRFLQVQQESDFLRWNNGQLEAVPLPESTPTLRTFYHWYDIDSNGQIYLANQDTLYQMASSGEVLATTPFSDQCQDCPHLCFRFGSDQQLVLLANSRFYQLDRENNRFISHPANRFLPQKKSYLIRFLLEANGNIWACGGNQDLIFYHAAKDTLYQFQDVLKREIPLANDFKGVFKDHTGVVWVESRLGLLKVNVQALPFDTYFSELNEAGNYYSFRGLAEDPEGRIYAQYYGGIVRFDPAKDHPPKFYAPSAVGTFFNLHPEGDDIWLNAGTLLKTRSGTLQKVPGDFHENPVDDTGLFAQSEDGTLWWASHFFLQRLQRSEAGMRWMKELEFPGKALYKTEALHAGRNSKKLWISIRERLLEYQPDTRQQVWRDSFGLHATASRIMVIEEDEEGHLWLGTDVGLMYASPQGKTIQHFTTKDGLPDNFVCGLLSEGDSCLWLSTNSGLSRFSIPSRSFINFFEEDGLTSNEFNRASFYKARDGRLFFGGMRGINAFFPDEIMNAYRLGNEAPRLVLSSFEYTDERRDTTLRHLNLPDQEEIHLHHWDWSYAFEYALTDFSNPEEIFYSYQMEGYKDNWSAPSKFNFTRFNSLPSGKYTFRVKARDSRGHWLPNQLAIKLVVHPPWWATWWAYVLYIILLITLVYFLRRYELNRQRLKYNLQLEKVEADRLKELDSFKTQLYTNLTHEFRTPLTVILGMADQIRSHPKQYLQEGTRLIETNGKNLLRLVNQLLDLSKLENRSFQCQFQQGDIVPYLHYVTESFQTYANSKNLSLRFFSSVESLIMDYDPEQMKHVLVNLITNGLKFTPSGGEVMVRLLPTTDHLSIEVRDTGIGIPKAALPHIFDRFYQVDGSVSRTGEGTGIGLAHTLELVKLMGGHVTAESEEGNGSRFTVSLPIHRNAPLLETAWPDDVLSMPPPPGKVPVEKVTIVGEGLPQLLLVEDNPDVVLYLKSILSERYQINVAYNGKLGVEQAIEQVPDLIISDVMMPEKDGFKVCDELKNDERTSHIPFILLTAKADAASKIAGLRRGADAYLSKPFNKEELLVRLEMLLDRQKRMAAWFAQTLEGKSEPLVADAEIQETIQVEDAFIRKVSQIIEENYSDEQFALPQLCQKIGMSRSQLYRKMKALIETSPSEFIRSFRLAKAKSLLGTSNLNVSEVAWQVGYKDPAHFSRSFQDKFGFPPSELNK